MKLWLATLMLVFLLGGCGGPSAGEGGAGSGGGFAGFDCSGASPSFAKDVTPLFTSCSGGELCHGGGLIHPGGGGPSGGSGAWPYDSLVNVPASRDTCSSAGDLVKPGSIEESYLIHKLTGVEMCPETSRMPFGGSELPHEDIQTIADWICQGAKNN